MLKVYGFSRVNAIAHGHTRDLRVLWLGCKALQSAPLCCFEAGGTRTLDPGIMGQVVRRLETL